MRGVECVPSQTQPLSGGSHLIRPQGYTEHRKHRYEMKKRRTEMRAGGDEIIFIQRESPHLAIWKHHGTTIIRIAGIRGETVRVEGA